MCLCMRAADSIIIYQLKANGKNRSNQQPTNQSGSQSNMWMGCSLFAGKRISHRNRMMVFRRTWEDISYSNRNYYSIVFKKLRAESGQEKKRRWTKKNITEWKPNSNDIIQWLAGTFNSHWQWVPMDISIVAMWYIIQQHLQNEQEILKWKPNNGIRLCESCFYLIVHRTQSKIHKKNGEIMKIWWRREKAIAAYWNKYTDSDKLWSPKL